MIILDDSQSELLDLNVTGGDRAACLREADWKARQYFGDGSTLKRYVCNVEPVNETYGQRVTLWKMHVYYRRPREGVKEYHE